jgi:hypothetical protein
MLIGIQLIPFVFITTGSLQGFPSPEHRTLHDQTVADQFGLNASQMVLSFFFSPEDTLSIAIMLFSLISTTIAFVTMLVLGWLMHSHVQRGLKTTGAVSSTQKRGLRLQTQLTRTLAIQVCKQFRMLKNEFIHHFLNNFFTRTNYVGKSLKICSKYYIHCHS